MEEAPPRIDGKTRENTTAVVAVCAVDQGSVTGGCVWSGHTKHSSGGKGCTRQYPVTRVRGGGLFIVLLIAATRSSNGMVPNTLIKNVFSLIK